jgi:hypothetical protein
LDAIELPVLRLGLAGFSADQEAAVRSVVAASKMTQWQFGAMAGADAWVVNGQCTQHLGGGRIRVASRQPGGRSVQLQLEGGARPVAFASPLPPSLEAGLLLDVARPESILEAISVFEFVLAPQAVQYQLAALIVDQQEALGSGAFEVRAKGHLIATVDMRGEAAVLPSARATNFESAVWRRVERDRLEVPPNFARVTLSELMWRYVCRTSRAEVLPERYKVRPIFFRRAPRVEAVLVAEEHLLVMRELAARPSPFEELRERVGLEEATLSRVLAALYYVGSITCTKARAAPGTQGDLAGGRMPPRNSTLTTGEFEAADLRQLTAPAPLVVE